MENSLSEYELLRLRNIKRNHEFLKSLGEYAKKKLIIIIFARFTTGSPSSKYKDLYEKKPVVSVTYENERISIKNSLPYIKCVLRLSCVVHGPIYGRFMSCTVNGFLSMLKVFRFFSIQILIFRMLCNRPMFANVHISSLRYLWIYMQKSKTIKGRT